MHNPRSHRAFSGQKAREVVCLVSWLPRRLDDAAFENLVDGFESFYRASNLSWVVHCNVAVEAALSPLISCYVQAR